MNTSPSRGRLVEWKNVRFVIDFSRGQRFDPRRRKLLFRRDLFSKCFAQRFDRNPISNGFIQSRNLVRSAVAAICYCMKRKCSLGNWSYDVIMRQNDVI